MIIKVKIEQHKEALTKFQLILSYSGNQSIKLIRKLKRQINKTLREDMQKTVTY